MKILISAAETSSDIHGAELLKALREHAPEGARIEAFGIGGPKLQAEGLRALVDARELLAMGFTEIIGRIPRIVSALDQLTEAAQREKPDVAVVIDYPDFHFRLARRLKSLGVPLVYYIPPKVWVWRKGRIAELQENFRKLLCIFPFEESFYRDSKVQATYVGNPLMDELPLGLSRAEARERLGLQTSDHVLTLMPGSRSSELKRHIPLMLEAAVRAAARLRSAAWLGAEETLKILMPVPATADFARVSDWIERWQGANSFPILDIRFSRGNSAESLVAADAALVKSGTSTLEAGLLGCPHAVVYRPSWLSARLFEILVRYRGPVGLVNLVSGWKEGDPYLVEEILLEEATPDRLADAAVSLLTDSRKREQLLKGFRSLRQNLELSAEAPRHSVKAALEILEVASCPRS